MRAMKPLGMSLQGVGRPSVTGRYIRAAVQPLLSQAKHTVALRYQLPPPPGCATGRYIDRKDLGDVADFTEACSVSMRDARVSLHPEATLDTHGFELFPSWPSAVTNFRDKEEVRAVYHQEVRDLVKRVSGASEVFVFDHTVRESGATSLNAVGEHTVAATVARVHCDYTVDGAPKRLQQLGDAGELYSELKGRHLTKEEVSAMMQQETKKGRYAFINVWRSTDDEHPVLQHPLAVCDERSVPKDDVFLYELRFPDRTGENYSLRYNPKHEWYYYPKMTKDECLLFKVFDTKENGGPRFVFHTAFDEPTTLMTPTADEDNGATLSSVTSSPLPPRKSIEVRTIAFFDNDANDNDDDKVDHECQNNKTDPSKLCSNDAEKKITFFDMKHSNNAARIRLWRDFMPSEVQAAIDVKTITYDDLQTKEFAQVNPLKKVPALVRSDGASVFESSVILAYLEDKFSSPPPPSPFSLSTTSPMPSFLPCTPELRQVMNLQIRLHDLYVASPNCTAPGFTHSQGALYLSNAWHGEARGMSVAHRAAKVAELWKQLVWLEGSLEACETKEGFDVEAVSFESNEKGQQVSSGPFLTGANLSLSDFTWFPTITFMEYMLPRVFGWSYNLFDDDSDNQQAALDYSRKQQASLSTSTPFPRLARWYTHCRSIEHGHAENIGADSDGVGGSGDGVGSGADAPLRRPFEETRGAIWSHWEAMEEAGQFAPIKEEVKAFPEHKWVYP